MRNRRNRTRLATAALAVVLLAAGCDSSGSHVEIDPLDGLTPDQREVVATAETYLDEEADLTLDDGDELVFVRLDDGPGVSHVAFGHNVLDRLVLGSEIVVHVLTDGTVQGVTDTLTSARPTDATEAELSADEAEEIATKSFDADGRAFGQTELVWHQSGEDLQLVYRVDVEIDDPPASYEVLVDAITGDIVQTTDLLVGQSAACTLPDAPSACVFVPDPVSAAEGQAVSPTTADQYLDGVELQGLTDPASGRLVGEFVDVDPPDAPEAAPAQPDGTWEAGRGQPGFEHAMVYYWIDRGQRKLQELGFTDIRNGPMVVYAVDRNYIDNAHYSGATNRIEFGVASGNGTSFAEDAQVVLHEYGHAILDQQAPGLFRGAAGNGAAYHEAFGDLWAYLVTLEERTGVGEQDDACLAPWFGEGCFRRMDSDASEPESLEFEEHVDSGIYTGAIFDVLEALLDAQGLTIDDCIGSDACNEVRDRVLSTLISSNGYIGDYVSFDDLAANYLLANEALYGGADAETIATAISTHGINPAGTPESDVAINLEVFHENRTELSVVAGVQDAQGQDLCEPVPLWSPGDQPSYSKLRGRFEVTGSDCAALGAPSPDQRWYVRLADTTLGEGTGAVFAASVSVGREQFTVPSEAFLPDGDPSGVTILFDGSGQPIEPVEPENPTSGEVVVDMAITHEYTGDLYVAGGVVAPDGTVQCSVTALEPAEDEGTGGVAGTVDLSACAGAGAYPPTAQNNWFVIVADTGPLDLGTVDQMTLTGPDGEVRQSPLPLPASIADAGTGPPLLFVWSS